MNKFQSEAYQNFIQSHIRLNHYIKISTGAVIDLHNSYTTPENLSLKVSEIIVNAGEKWTPTTVKKPHAELIQVTNDLSLSGIIWAYSAFDVYFKKIEGYLSSYFTNSNLKDEDNDKSHKTAELYEKLNWDKKNIENLLPILKFYESLRHSVAHNVGIPSGKIVQIYESTEFKEAINNWQTKFPNRKITPPPIITDTLIILKPHHPIMYSETCLRIAADININLLKKLGVNYFINSTLKRHLSDSSTLSTPHCQNLTRYVVYHLNNDYKITLEKYDDIYDIFNDLDTKTRESKIKEYKKRYSTLKNS